MATMYSLDKDTFNVKIQLSNGSTVNYNKVHYLNDTMSEYVVCNDDKVILMPKTAVFKVILPYRCYKNSSLDEIIQTKTYIETTEKPHYGDQLINYGHTI